MRIGIESIWPEDMEFYKTSCEGRYYPYQLIYYKNSEPRILESFEAKDFDVICNFVVDNSEEITPVRLIEALY